MSNKFSEEAIQSLNTILEKGFNPNNIKDTILSDQELSTTFDSGTVEEFFSLLKIDPSQFSQETETNLEASTIEEKIKAIALHVSTQEIDELYSEDFFNIALKELIRVASLESSDHEEYSEMEENIAEIESIKEESIEELSIAEEKNFEIDIEGIKARVLDDLPLNPVDEVFGSDVTDQIVNILIEYLCFEETLRAKGTLDTFSENTPRTKMQGIEKLVKLERKILMNAGSKNNENNRKRIFNVFSAAIDKLLNSPEVGEDVELNTYAVDERIDTYLEQDPALKSLLDSIRDKIKSNSQLELTVLDGTPNKDTMFDSLLHIKLRSTEELRNSYGKLYERHSTVNKHGMHEMLDRFVALHLAKRLSAESDDNTQDIIDAAKEFVFKNIELSDAEKDTIWRDFTTESIADVVASQENAYHRTFMVMARKQCVMNELLVSQEKEKEKNANG